MAEITVTQSVVNAGKGSLAWHLTRILNQIVAATTGTGLLSAPVIDENAEDIAHGAFTYQINGVRYAKAAATNVNFTANHVVTALHFGAILVQINAAGSVSTLIDEATQTTAMAYDTAEEAIAALPASPSAGNVAMGYILIEADAGNWVGNTDDMSTDLESVVFVDYDAIPTPDTIVFRNVGAPE